MTTSRALVAKSPSGKANSASTSQAKPSIWRTETDAILSSSPSYSFGDVPLYDRDGNERQIPHPFRLPWPVQAKLEVGAPNDPLEHEADNVADRIMRMPDTPDARPAESLVPSQLQRKCSCRGSCEKCKAEEDDKHGQLQKKTAETVVPQHTSVPPIVHQVLRSPGQPLDKTTRAFFEPRFGYDFTKVRVHTGAAAKQSTEVIGARAYTVGHQIVFGSGTPAPTTADARLLAHELTHVVQQGRNTNQSMVRRAPAAQTEAKADPGATCSLEQHRKIEPAANKAGVWLSQAIPAIDDFLAGAKTKQAQTAAALLTKHFHSTDRAVVSYVRNRLSTIQSDIFGRQNFHVNCPPASDQQCALGTTGEELVARVPNSNEIDFCGPFFQRGVDDDASTIIHEFAHALLGLSKTQDIIDRAYKSDRYYAYLTTAEALTNAESYAMLAREIATGSSPAPGEVSDDIGKTCPQDWIPSIMDAMRAARMWNHKAALNTRAQHEFSRVYKLMDDKLMSQLSFKCILDKGFRGRCEAGVAYWLFAGDLRICANWRAISSPENRAIEMLASLYGYKSVMDDSAGASEKRRKAAREARRLHAASVPSSADVLSGK